VTKNVDSRHFI